VRGYGCPVRAANARALGACKCPPCANATEVMPHTQTHSQGLRGGGVWGGRVPTPRGYPASPQGLLFLAHYGGRVPSGCRRSVPEKTLLGGLAALGYPLGDLPAMDDRASP